ncbi:hypothetical protein [Spiroplasma floricola]|uniref:Transmembrane protein n=1 Tax=Spiroplasma floricola 23-6 TaxID=1336749 RepID=A0A2K8SG80_9MOLU|nr:hypothetical protein [Spiroplasma floricola]AUB31820.1 hypothetical protein SFLOR_v1c07720 [Spiroplasma floricola 23-6]
MKKFSNFLIKLKPYKRLYKIFWMVFIIACLFIFQIIMLSLSYAVPHKNGGFYYWIKGLYFLFGESIVEPKSAQGFIFAATVIGCLPIIPIIPILYFTFANWLIQEKLSDKFINVPKDKYLYWTTFIHFSGIAVIFFIIPGLLTYINGGGILPHQAYIAVPGAFSDNIAERIAGVSGIVYYAIGCVFTAIILFWTLWLALCWLGRQIQKLIEVFNQWRLLQKDKKRKLKLEKLDSKKSKKKNN